MESTNVIVRNAKAWAANADGKAANEMKWFKGRILALRDEGKRLQERLRRQSEWGYSEMLSAAVRRLGEAADWNVQ